MKHAKLPAGPCGAERKASEEARQQSRQVAEAPHVCALLECFPVPAVIVNQQRQLLAANQKLACLLGRPVESLLGMCTSEVFHCIHSEEEPGGCGTSIFCAMCGATRALRRNRTESCRMICRTVEGWQALDVRVQAAPLTIGQDQFMVVSLMDITCEKRRMVLEQMFFHDVLDTAAGIHGVLDLLPGLADPEAAKLLKIARRQSGELVEQIRAGRDLCAAERGELETNLCVLQVAPFIDRLCAVYRHTAICDRKIIRCRCSPESATLLTDERLLGRVLGNLVKNALEASSPGETVTLQFHHEEGNSTATFCVHNQCAMPEPVRLQIFRRSFSTKAIRGRGIGTYSVKILTERYLKGRVTFRSVPGEGTTFTVMLPQCQAKAARAAR